MTQRTCTIPDCKNPVIARGWCEAHYRRWRSHGDPTYTKRAAWRAKHDAQNGHKLCSLCEQRKPVDQFSVSRAARDGLQQRCKPCQIVRTAETRDPIKAKQAQTDYKRRNAEYLRQKRREYRAVNIDKEREYSRLYHQKNRERRRQYDQTRRQARANQCKAWRTQERSRCFTAKRRAIKLSAPLGDPSLRHEYARIINCDPCVYCGAPSQAEDHIKPLTKGGADAWDNLAPACTSCNSSKSNRELLEFLMMRRG